MARTIPSSKGIGAQSRQDRKSGIGGLKGGGQLQR